jgi:hypothetical protein
MSDSLIDPRAILAKMDEVRAETLRRLNDLTQEELDWRPGTKLADTGADEWSLGEVFMHIAIDEHHLRENIARPLLEDVKPPESIEFLPPPPPCDLPKDAILFWFERTRLLTRRLLQNFPADANLAESEERAQSIMNSDPAVWKGVMHAELFPFRIALAGKIHDILEDRS